MSLMKGHPMSKDETLLLLDLVEESQIINVKATDALTNQQKETAWNKLTKKFNASPITDYPRRVDQIRLKWENLKKNARRKKASRFNVSVEMGQIKPDEITERVMSIMNSREKSQFEMSDDGEDNDSSNDAPEENRDSYVNCDDEILDESGMQKVNQVFVTETQAPEITFQDNSRSIEKQKLKLYHQEVRSRITRNQAISEYYKLKKKKLEADIENVMLNNKRLKIALAQNK